MNYNKEIPRKTIRQPGIVCRHCEIPFSATSVLSDDGNFTCRILYCEQCKTIVDKNWWSMPQMMAKHSIKTVAEATEDWGDGSTILTRRKPLTTSKHSTTLKEATRFQEERSLVNQKFHGRKEPENTDLHEEEEAELVKEKYVCHCSFCGEAGHNRRSCVKLAGRNNATLEMVRSQEIDDLPTLQSCSVCGAQGHNKRTCKVGPLVLQPRNQ